MPMSPGFLVAYVVLCLVVGVFGRGRAIGFPGVFVVSFVVTPLLMALVLILTAPKQAS